MVEKNPSGLRMTSRVGGLGECFDSGGFQGEIPDKLGASNQVAMPQSARFRSQTEQPLQPILAHPGWRLAGSAGKEIERGPYADHNRHSQQASVFRHPGFLLGGAEPHPKYVGLRRPNAAHKLEFLLEIEPAKGR